MSEAELLVEIKKGLGVSGNYHDSTLLRHLKDVKAYCKSAGVSDEILSSDASVGCLIRGIADAWTQESGTTRFSLMFQQRLIQLIILSQTQETSDG